MTHRTVFSSILLVCGTLCIAGALALASYVAHESAMLQGQHNQIVATMVENGATQVQASGTWAYQRTADGLTWLAAGAGIVLLLTGLWRGLGAAASGRTMPAE